MVWEALRAFPLAASVQASHPALADPETLWRLAQPSLEAGVRVLRLEGLETVAYFRQRFDGPIVGLVKRFGDDAYITPSVSDVLGLIESGADLIAIDATDAARDLPDKLAAVHAAGRLAMADLDTPEAAERAVRLGFDALGTTLAGYTPRRDATSGPDLDLVRALSRLGKPVLAEGRYAERWQVEAALSIGAAGVVVGGALNDPLKQTRALMPQDVTEPVGAVDIGGTWLRFAVFSDGNLGPVARIPLPRAPAERLTWIESQARAAGVRRVGIGTGGTVDPATRTVIEAKAIIPGHVGTRFAFEGIECCALNDGLATAWGHACHPDFAGRAVATLALGTGVGCGFVARGRLAMGPRGEYPRLNDLPAVGAQSYEDLLGGAGLTPDPDAQARERAIDALESAVATMRALWMPEAIVAAGSVGLCEWMRPELTRLRLEPSPYGAEAGLWGAAWLARRPYLP